MYVRPSSSDPCVALHFVPHSHSTQAQPIRSVGSSAYSLPRKWPVNPLAGLLPPLATRCSLSTFPLATSISVFLSACRLQGVLLSTHDACSPPLCVRLFGIVCVDGAIILSLCGLISPCCWVGEYVRTRCPRCPALNPINEVFSTFE